MKLPLYIQQEYGEFAFHNPQQGVDAIKAIQAFLEDGENSAGAAAEHRQVTIERKADGTVQCH